MLLQTNSYVVPRDRRAEHARLLRRFRQVLSRLGCDYFEIYEQVGSNWNSEQASGRFVQIMRFRDRRHQLAVQSAERSDPAAQAIIAEFCELINFPYQQQHGYFAVGYYTSVLSGGSLKYSQPEDAGDAIPEEQIASAQAAAMAASGLSEVAPPDQQSYEAPYAEHVDATALEADDRPVPHQNPAAPYLRPTDFDAETHEISESAPADEETAFETETAGPAGASAQAGEVGAHESRAQEEEEAEVDAAYIEKDLDAMIEELGAPAEAELDEFPPGSANGTGLRADVGSDLGVVDPHAAPLMAGEPVEATPDAGENGIDDDFDAFLAGEVGEESAADEAGGPGAAADANAGDDPDIGRVLDAGLADDSELDKPMPAELIEEEDDPFNPPAPDTYRLHGRREDEK